MLKLVRREADIMWRLSTHPNCVRLVGRCEEPGHQGLVLEFCNHGTLQENLYEMRTEGGKARSVPFRGGPAARPGPFLMGSSGTGGASGRADCP